jgi:hypothetical protein
MDAIENFSSAIDECMMSSNDDQILERYMRICFYQIRKLMNDLPKEWLSAIENADDLYLPSSKDPYIQVAIRMEELMYYLSDAYGNYFDASEFAPDILRELIKQRLWMPVSFISAWLKHAGEELAELHWIIMDTFNSLDREYHAEPLTFGRVSYINILSNILVPFLEDRHDDIKEQELYEFLLQSNMNGAEFYLYAVERYREKLKSLNPKEKVQMLRQFKVEVVEAYADTTLAYNYSEPSLKDMLIKWMDTEIDLYL